MFAGMNKKLLILLFLDISVSPFLKTFRNKSRMCFANMLLEKILKLGFSPLLPVDHTTMYSLRYRGMLYYRRL